jgi:hypothetical protein
MTAWAHLVNAAHIDRILAHSKANPNAWVAARDAAWDAARGAVWDAVRVAARVAARDAARDAARGAALDAVWVAARAAARGAVWDAITALIAWDDCAYMLDMPADALKVLIAVGNQQAILLAPAAALHTKGE